MRTPYFHKLSLVKKKCKLYSKIYGMLLISVKKVTNFLHQLFIKFTCVMKLAALLEFPSGRIFV